MSDLERNKQTVREYLDLAFNQGRPEEAAQRYQGPTYIQHNPAAPNGAEAFIAFVKDFRGQFPELRVDFKRFIAEGDFAVLHCHVKTTPEDRGVAVVDIVRLENGKLVEHWDVVQPVPETSANDNTMF